MRELEVTEQMIRAGVRVHWRDRTVNGGLRSPEEAVREVYRAMRSLEPIAADAGGSDDTLAGISAHTDQDLRLECVRLAVGAGAGPWGVMECAAAIETFVRGADR